MHLAEGCLGSQEADARQLQRIRLAGTGGEVQLQLGGICPEIQCLDDFHNAGQFLRNDQRGAIDRRTVQRDLSASDHIDALQVEAGQRDTDHPVGKNQAGPRFGQAQYLGHAIRA